MERPVDTTLGVLVTKFNRKQRESEPDGEGPHEGAPVVHKLAEGVELSAGIKEAYEPLSESSINDPYGLKDDKSP